MSTTAEEDDLIINMVKESECLYNKRHRNYYKKTIKDKLFGEMAELLNIKLNSTLSSINVKKRWECIRKSYANALRKNREQYVYFNQMDFLKEFILLQDADKYLDKENDEIQSKVMPSSLFSVHQRKTLNLFDKFSRAETSSKNVLSEKSSNAFSKVAGTSTLNNAFTKKKEDEIELLQKQIVIAAQDTMKSVEKSGKDCFEIAIMETLRLVNENRLINCLPGVFDILLEYQNKK